ncbi:DUF1223 domain-containing protein [Rhodoferax sp. GW822-FHT02A01]|uniref:DUF1223 domain-containing protein n=1 Tax=Rhodoferax sp. GW822-FHT02A01 TaxID=3141537 RepID=UPI00315C7232
MWFSSAVISAVAWAAPTSCEVTSGDRLTPVIELYTSEGCSSCPPADQWLSTMKGKPVVAQAFHVAYWDYIGWKDPFANPAFTVRQREIAFANRLSGIYTPQLVRNGRDWANWRQSLQAVDFNASAKATIHLQGGTRANAFEARVTPVAGSGPWTAYWTTTEHNYSSHVKAGENAGEYLKHDFVVRQYAPVGRYEGAQTLTFYAIPAQADHPRQINLVVSDIQTGETLQAVSLSCS